jgi:hypothetical protein
MMIKRLFLMMVITVTLSLPSLGQVIFWEETFNEAPAGWELEGNWSFMPGNLLFYYYPINLNYDHSVITSPIALPANAGDLTVNQFIDVYEPTVTSEQSQISVIHDGNETVLWNYQNNLGDWGVYEGMDIVFPVNQFAGQTIQLKFRTWGPTTDAWNSWAIFKLSMTSYFDNDLSAAGIYGPTCVAVNTPTTWEVMVKNTGLNTQSGFSVDLFCYISDESLGSVVVNDPLNSGQTGLYEISWTPEAVVNTGLYAVVETPADDNLSNNVSESHFLRIKPNEVYNVLFWDYDNGIETIVNPESGMSEQCHVGLTKALNQAGIMYEYTNVLPEDLSPYDLVISTMGCYCLS